MDFVIKSNIVEEVIKSQHLSVINEQPPTMTFCLDFVFLDSSDFEICLKFVLTFFRAFPRHFDLDVTQLRVGSSSSGRVQVAQTHGPGSHSRQSHACRQQN